MSHKLDINDRVRIFNQNSDKNFIVRKIKDNYIYVAPDVVSENFIILIYSNNKFNVNGTSENFEIICFDNKIENLLEKLSKEKYLHNGEHAIDPIKKINYLNSIKDERYKKIVKYIIDHTIYVTMSTLLDKISININKFLSEVNDDFYLLFQDKIGSEQYLTAQFYDQLKNNSYYKGVIKNNSYISHGHILIIDDAIYSGNNTLVTIDEYTYYNVKNKNNLDCWAGEEIISKKTKKLFKNVYFNILTAYVSAGGKESINYFCDSSGINCVFSTEETLISISEYCEKDKLINDYKYTSKILKPECDPCGLYFDHKVANEFGTYPQIYLEGRREDGSSFGTILTNLPFRPL